MSIVFIQQGLSKFPFKLEDAQAYDLPFLVLWFVAYGELGAGLGLIFGGLFLFKKNAYEWLGDLITRFSGLTIGTAVIDEQALQSGTFRVPVLSKSDNVIIEIQNAKHLPCRFQSAEYEGFLVVRSPRS